MFASQKDGVSALSLQRTLEIGSYATAWAMLHRLRSVLVRPGRRLTRPELDRYCGHGERAVPRDGVQPPVLVDLHLSAAWRLWRQLPAVGDSVRNLDRIHAVGEAVLRAADDAVAPLTAGYQQARLQIVGLCEMAERREFVDDLRPRRRRRAG
jgi:hypothetical protein